MLDFLKNMKSLTLYNQTNKVNKSTKKKSILDETSDDIQLEMIKYKNAVTQKGMATKVQAEMFNDYSSIGKLKSPIVSATASIKDNISNTNELSGIGIAANSKSKNIIDADISSNGIGTVSLSGYSMPLSSMSVGNIPNITQFGMMKMTGTEGNLKNGYTIGKNAIGRASASLDYITRDENGKSIAELKDKYGNVISKEDAKVVIKDIQGERRLVLSPNPRLNLNDEQLDKVVRDTMGSYSESFGKEFDYLYAIHNNTSTKHAHILMTTTHPDGDGIKMYKDETFELKMHFEDRLKEEVKDSGINIRDNSALPYAKQVGNFIGAIPDTNIFKQNQYLAQKMAKKFDIEYDQKEIGDNPEKLEEWFNKHQNEFKDYFMSAKNKEAFLFNEYIQSSINLSSKYDLGLTNKETTDIKVFNNWLDDKEFGRKEIFLADRIAQDKHLILQKEDVHDSKKLYKWFMENETEVKEWNEEYKYYPSKQMSSLANKYGDMVDKRPEHLLTDRKIAREFIRNYTRNPLIYAGDSRKSLYNILRTKQEQFKSEFKKERITEKTFNTENKRLDSLQNKLLKGQEISDGSLKKYNLDTKLFDKDTREIELDGINLKDKDGVVRKSLILKLDNHKINLDKDLEDKKIDKVYHSIHTKKINSLGYIISKADNMSVSALENIGLDKEKDLKDFKIEKVKTELKIINFKNTDLNKDIVDITKEEVINKSKPLQHQVQRISAISNKVEITADTFTLSNYKEANKWIDENKDTASKKQIEYAQNIANKRGIEFDSELSKDSSKLSEWINIEKDKPSIKMIEMAQNLEKTYRHIKIEDENIFENRKDLGEFLRVSLNSIDNKFVGTALTENTEINQDTYLKAFEEFIEKVGSDDIDLTNFTAANAEGFNDFYKILELAIENKDIQIMDKLYEVDPGASDGKELLESKFDSYAKALDISEDDVYGKMLEKHFDFDSEDIEKLENNKEVFVTNFEFYSLGEDNEFINIEDYQHQLYIDALGELVTEKYEEYQYQLLDMDNENISEEVQNKYYDSTGQIYIQSGELNNLIKEELEINTLKNEIEHNLEIGNFKIVDELMQDEKLDEFTRFALNQMYETALGQENILDEIYEDVLDAGDMEEKTYHIFKEEDFLADMKKIDLEVSKLNEIQEEIRQEELQEQELELGL